MAPEAMGRWRFTSWARSASTSMMSLRQYIAEAANENDINVRAAAIACVVLSMAPPKNTGRMTKIFFIQCIGRATFIMCFMFIAVYFLPDVEIFGIDVFFLL